MKKWLMFLFVASIFMGLNLPVFAANTPDTTTTGTENEYLNPSDFEVHTPPPGFDPLTASEDELNYYNYPRRPEDPKQLAEWKRIIQNEKTRVKPDSSFYKVKKAEYDTTGKKDYGYNYDAPTWTGFAYNYTQNQMNNYDATNGFYNEVVGEWNVPHILEDQPFTDSSTWVGLGGMPPINGTGGDSPLVQMGTQQGVDVSGNEFYYAWYEIVKTDHNMTEQKISNFQVDPGDQMYADVWFDWSGTDIMGTAHFYIQDQTKNTAFAYDITNIASWWGVNTSSEWITEKPKDCKLCLPTELTNFQDINWTFCKSGPNFNALENLAGANSMSYSAYIRMYTSSGTKADSGSIRGDGSLDAGAQYFDGEFWSRWYNYK